MFLLLFHSQMPQAFFPSPFPLLGAPRQEFPPAPSFIFFLSSPLRETVEVSRPIAPWGMTLSVWGGKGGVGPLGGASKPTTPPVDVVVHDAA